MNTIYIEDKNSTCGKSFILGKWLYEILQK